MDRTQLKTVFKSLNVGDKLKVNFGSDRGIETFKVLNKRVWKGKGGSLLAECVNVDTNEKENLGTFSANKIVNICVNDGEIVGLDGSATLPKVYPTDAVKTVALRTQFASLMGSKNLEVEVEASAAPELEGKFSVKSIRKTPGRGGPIVMDLVSLTDGSETILSSNRHSGVIDRVIVTSSSTVNEDETKSESV